ncbi:hypothetical protein ACFQ3F_17480 [Nocardioides ginsengisoli]|uniref:DUF4328 domain-containing protein n=1 Tax=Nocardioides ginsengisoli TaxID=363868 RepID=A0ABW3W3C0_9ACTN
MEDLLKVVGATVAAVASLAAVALAVDQFTLRARLRKTEEWAVKALAAEIDGNRVPVLTDIRHDSTARIVAGLLVPVWFFAEGVVWAVAAPSAVAVTVQASGTSTGTAAAITWVAFFALAFTFRPTVRHFLERCRVASEYRRGLPVAEPKRGLLAAMEGGYRVEFVFAAGFSAGACALGLGVGLAVSGHDVDGWPLALMLLGGFSAYGVLDLLRVYARSRHPMRDPS